MLVCTTLLASSCNGLRGVPDPFPIRELTKSELQEHGLYNLRYIDRRADPNDDLVQLIMRRSLIMPCLAVHPFFRTYDHSADRWDEWDVYALRGVTYREEANKILAPSADGMSVEETTWFMRRWGTIDKLENLTFISNDGVVMGQWWGQEARAILEVFSRPHDYPYIETYRYWPGPNSNTYAVWVLDQAGLRVDHHPQAVGKDYVGWWGFGARTTSTKSGIQVETPVVGVKLGLQDGAELHVLGLTLGGDLSPPALKTPFGRFGMAEQ